MSKKKKSSKPKKLNLSVSKISLFEQCPRKYYYKYILKLPDIATYHSAAGTFLHKALEFFILEYIKTNETRSSAQKAFIDAKKDKEIVNLGGLVTPELCEEVKQWLKSYVLLLEEHPEKIPTFLHAETRFRHVLDNTNIVINGFIDRIDQVDKDTVHIVDYKTGREDYLTPFQLTTYSIPAQQMFPGKNVLASYEMVKQNFKQITYDISDKDREEAMDRFKQVGKQIEELTIKDDPSAWKPNPSRLCNYCPYKVRCAQDNHTSWPR